MPSNTTNPIASTLSSRLIDLQDKLNEAADLARIFVMIDSVGCRREEAALGLVADNLIERLDGLSDALEAIRKEHLPVAEAAMLTAGLEKAA